MLFDITYCQVIILFDITDYQLMMLFDIKDCQLMMLFDITDCQLMMMFDSAHTRKSLLRAAHVKQPINNSVTLSQLLSLCGVGCLMLNSLPSTPSDNAVLLEFVMTGKQFV